MAEGLRVRGPLRWQRAVALGRRRLHATRASQVNNIRGWSKTSSFGAVWEWGLLSSPRSKAVCVQMGRSTAVHEVVHRPPMRTANVTYCFRWLSRVFTVAPAVRAG